MTSKSEFDLTWVFYSTIFAFSLRDKYVHLHECSPFWVGIFIVLKKEKLPCLLFDVDMPILIGKALNHFIYYMKV